MKFEFRSRFSIARTNSNNDSDKWIFRDSLSPRSTRIINAKRIPLQTKAEKLAAMRILVPLCVGHSPLPVRDRPGTAADANFWQYPAITERLAFERHAELPLPDWQPSVPGPINIYLGLPWATYIDKKNVPSDVRQVFRVRLSGYRALAEEWDLQWGKDLLVHTVCQHIYWERLLPVWMEFGVTNLHLSHCEPGSAVIAKPYGICVHSWPLVAPNVVNAERREGLSIGKPLADRTKLASFIGAYMPHYRSNVRLSLRDEVMRDSGHDVIFELKEAWHYNPIVYGSPEKDTSLDDDGITAERSANTIYNQALSNSVFALCPEGAGPNTLRLWEALAVGAIPVVIVGDWIWPSTQEFGLSWNDAVIRVGSNDIHGLLNRLRRMLSDQPERLEVMQLAGIELYEYFSRLRCF